jgi:hypothetical protein
MGARSIHWLPAGRMVELVGRHLWGGGQHRYCVLHGASLLFCCTQRLQQLPKVRKHVLHVLMGKSFRTALHELWLAVIPRAER